MINRFPFQEVGFLGNYVDAKYRDEVGQTNTDKLGPSVECRLVHEDKAGGNPCNDYEWLQNGGDIDLVVVLKGYVQS